MSAATITAIISPRSPGGRREVFGPRAFSAFTADPISQAHSQLVPRGSTRRRRNSGVGANRRDSEGWVGQSPLRSQGRSFIWGLSSSAQSPFFPAALPSCPPPQIRAQANVLLSGCPGGTQLRGEGTITCRQEFQHKFGIRDVRAAGGVATDLLADFWVCASHLVYGGNKPRAKQTDPQRPRPGPNTAWRRPAPGDRATVNKCTVQLNKKELRLNKPWPCYLTILDLSCRICKTGTVTELYFLRLW